MFSIDERGLKTSIGLGLIPSFKQEESLEDNVTYHFHLLMGMAVSCLNSKEPTVDDAIDAELEKLNGDFKLVALMPILRCLILDAKKQFISAGFDRRLKYKLYTREIGMLKIYGIGMDLDSTFEEMLASPKVEEESISDAVSGEPTLEQLERSYNW